MRYTAQHELPRELADDTTPAYANLEGNIRQAWAGGDGFTGWFKEGTLLTQEEMTELNAESLASTRDYWHAMRVAAQSRTATDYKLRRLLCYDLDTAQAMMTSTKAQYDISGAGTLIHNWGSRRENQVSVNLVGKSDFLELLPDAEIICEAYFGTRDVRDVALASTALLGVRPFIIRRDRAPEKEPDHSPVMLTVQHSPYFPYGPYALLICTGSRSNMSKEGCSRAMTIEQTS